MERKLENELPVKGKFYKRIAETNPEFTKGTVYECITSGELIDNLGIPSKYFTEEVFSENFVEVVEIKDVNKVQIKVDCLDIEEVNKLLEVFLSYGFGKHNSLNTEIESIGEHSFNYLMINSEGYVWLSTKENRYKTMSYADFMYEYERKHKFSEPIGVKHDQNKLPLYTITFKQFPLAIQAVAKRALAGHNKYIETDADWQNFARAGEQDPDSLS